MKKNLSKFLLAQITAQNSILNLLVNQHIRLLNLLSDDHRAQFLSEFKLKLDIANKEVLLMAFPLLPAEQSDLMAGEFQEAFEALARQLETRFELPRT